MKLEDIKTIGVVGGGVMGGGIAQTAILAGYKVIIRDLTDEICEKTKDVIVDGRFGLNSVVARGKVTQQQMDQALANLAFTIKVEDLKDCDIIIEAVGGGETAAIENKPLKLKIFAELDKTVKKDAIFASNTSRFTIADLNKAVERKSLFIGMHWFSPANIMKLVELAYTPDTAEEVIQVLEGLCQRFGKTSVRVKDVPGDTGFVNNRIFGVVREEAQKIVDEGICSEEDVDIIMRLGRNWPAGPFESTGGARSGWD